MDLNLNSKTIFFFFSLLNQTFLANPAGKSEGVNILNDLCFCHCTKQMINYSLIYKAAYYYNNPTLKFTKEPCCEIARLTRLARQHLVFTYNLSCR